MLWPRRACGFTCVDLAGTSEGLAGPRVLEGAHCRCCGPSDLAGSFLMEILHCGEGGDVEQVARTSKQFSCVCDCSSLSTHLLFITCSHYYYLYMLDIYTCAKLIYLLGLFNI